MLVFVGVTPRRENITCVELTNIAKLRSKIEQTI